MSIGQVYLYRCNCYRCCRRDILNCSQLSDLHAKKQYRVVVLSYLIENIPVFDMNQVWEKVKETVCAGGLIVIKTALYESPNVLAADEKLTIIL